MQLFCKVLLMCYASLQASATK